MGSSGNAFRDQCIEKVGRLKALGIDPYPSTSARTHMASDIHERFAELENSEVTVAGRMMSRRGHGQLVFADAQDQTGGRWGGPRAGARHRYIRNTPKVVSGMGAL